MPGLFPELPKGAKCTRCKAQATIRLPHHHAIFCSECFLQFFRNAVAKALKKFGTTPGTPLLVAVSGGKDSLAMWNVLRDLGYETKGLHIDLGIEAGFSRASAEAIERFASPRNLPWVTYSLKETIGYSITDIRRKTRRKICSVCGFLKRQMLNRLTIRENYRALAVGHNLDDEAGRLLGNMVRHRTRYFEKQYPYLPSDHPRLPARLKPLYRLEADEIRIYCAETGIIPLDGRCPLSRGATSHIFKEALDFLEDRMPGTKRDFLFSFLKKREQPSLDPDIGSCTRCGEPCYGETCSVCRLLNQLRGEDPP
ncbi:MAG TPA: ATP-binding protein [Syntrophobacter fumaroxidans]|nr:ATP-binding protein [Syntrophobacter fumaroxidans]